MRLRTYYSATHRCSAFVIEASPTRSCSRREPQCSDFCSSPLVSIGVFTCLWAARFALCTACSYDQVRKSFPKMQEPARSIQTDSLAFHSVASQCCGNARWNKATGCCHTLSKKVGQNKRLTLSTHLLGCCTKPYSCSLTPCIGQMRQEKQRKQGAHQTHRMGFQALQHLSPNLTCKEEINAKAIYPKLSNARLFKSAPTQCL